MYTNIIVKISCNGKFIIDDQGIRSESPLSLEFKVIENNSNFIISIEKKIDNYDSFIFGSNVNGENIRCQISINNRDLDYKWKDLRIVNPLLTKIDTFGNSSVRVNMQMNTCVLNARGNSHVFLEKDYSNSSIECYLSGSSKFSGRNISKLIANTTDNSEILTISVINHITLNLSGNAKCNLSRYRTCGIETKLDGKWFTAYTNDPMIPSNGKFIFDINEGEVIVNSSGTFKWNPTTSATGKVSEIFIPSNEGYYISYKEAKEKYPDYAIVCYTTLCN